MLLGHQAGQVWAEDLRQSFRHTPLWQLAFWEWIGTGLTYVFLALSVQLLPALDESTSPRSSQATSPTEADGDTLRHGQWTPS